MISATADIIVASAFVIVASFSVIGAIAAMLVGSIIYKAWRQ